METENKMRLLLLFPDATVAERVKDFRERYPDWKILPEIIEVNSEWIVMKVVNNSEQYEIHKIHRRNSVELEIKS